MATSYGQITLSKLEETYSVILSNESHTFSGSSTAALGGSTESSVIAYKGDERVPATIGTISGAPTGMSVSRSNNGTVNAKFTVTVDTTMTTKSGVLTIPITVDGNSFEKKFSYSLALTGATGPVGETGKGIESIVKQYNLYTSDSSAPPEGDSGWSSTPAEYINGKYYWVRDFITWTDGSTSFSEAVLDNGLNSANSKAQEAQETVDNMKIGGRNAILDSDVTYVMYSDGEAQDITFVLSNSFDPNLIKTSGLAYSYDIYNPNPGQSISGDFAGKFGGHIEIVYVDANGLTQTTYVCDSEFTVNNYHSKKIRVSSMTDTKELFATAQSITRINAHLHLYARPTSSSVTWTIGYPKLELGTVASDWTPAPEDMVSRFDSIAPTVANHTTKLEQLEDSVQSLVETEFVKVSDVDATDENGQPLEGTLMQKWRNDITQTANQLTIDISNVQDLVYYGEDDTIKTRLEGFEQEVHSRFTFTENGLIISNGESNALRLQLDNDIIGFYKGAETTPMAYWDGTTLHTGNVEVAQFRLGWFTADPRSDHSVVWNWKEGE